MSGATCPITSGRKKHKHVIALKERGREAREMLPERKWKSESSRARGSHFLSHEDGVGKRLTRGQ